MSRLESRWATQADIEQFYGGPVPYTIWSRVTLLNDKVIGVVGYRIVHGMAYVFSEITPEMKNYPVRIWREGKRILERIGSLKAIATADQSIPTSRQFLERLGFEYAGESVNGGVYVWRN